MKPRTQTPRKCDLCPALLARDYPYNLCPACWHAQYGAPPGMYSPWYRAAMPKRTEATGGMYQ